MNFINENSAGGRIGQNIGSGISKTLDTLSAHKLQSLEEKQQLASAYRARQQESSALSALGIPSHISDAISNLGDQNLKRNILENLGGLGDNTAQINLSGLGNNNQMQSRQNQVRSEQDNANIFLPQAEKRKNRELGLKERKTEFDNQLATKKQEFTEKNAKESRALEEKIANSKNALQRELLQKKLNVELTKEKRRSGEFDRKLAQDLDKFNKSLEADTKKAQAKEQELGHKETKQYYDQTLASGEAARLANDRLGKMEKLIDKGGLPVSGFYKLFKNLEEKFSGAGGATAGGITGAGVGTVLGGPGIGTAIGTAVGSGVGALLSPISTMLRYGQRQTSPNTEEFEKLSAEFIRDVKQIFGGRVTNLDLETFLKSIPTLENSDSGKRAIIKNMKLFNRGVEARVKALKDIVQENGGKRPYDLQIQVEERVAPILNRLANGFTAGA